MWSRVQKCTAILGVAVHKSKCFAFTNVEAVYSCWKSIGGPDQLEVQPHFVYLGARTAPLPIPDAEALELPEKAKLEALVHRRLARIKVLLLVMEQKAVIVAAAIMNVVVFALFGWQWQQKKRCAIRTRVMAALQGAAHPKTHAAKEMFMFLLTQGPCARPSLRKDD